MVHINYKKYSPLAVIYEKLLIQESNNVRWRKQVMPRMQSKKLTKKEKDEKRKAKKEAEKTKTA